MEEVKVLINQEKIEERLDELADQIMRDYGDEEIIVLCILKGALFFTVDLTKRIKNKMIYDFMKVSSYGNSKSTTGEVKIIQDAKLDFYDKNVLIVEDIVDSGYTMDFMKKYLEMRKAKSVKIAAMLSKPERREVEVKIDYLGFEIPNKFIVGYGLDNEEYLRNLPYIGYIE